MAVFLRLKHWQLFLLIWGIPIVMNALSIADPILLLKLFPFVTIAFAFGFFGWIWAIATELHKRLPVGVNISIRQFKIVFMLPVAYLLVIMGILTAFIFNPASEKNPENDVNGLLIALIIVLHLASTVCILLALRLATKIFKSVELGRLAAFGDYSGEFFLIWFSPIGVWFIQPRLNGFMKHRSEENIIQEEI